jgi:hypothetical protein
MYFFYDLKRMLSASNTESRLFYWIITIASIVVYIFDIVMIILTILGKFAGARPLVITLALASFVLVTGMWVFLAKRE